MDKKYAGTALILGLVVSFVMLGLNALFDVMGIEVVWTDFGGILLSIAVVPFIYGTLIHGVDSITQDQDFGEGWNVAFLIWVVGVVVAFIMTAFVSLLALFNLKASFTDVGGVLVMFLVVPWATGFAGRGVDDKLTEG